MKPVAHFCENYLINPTNQITVNLIGVGGTGSQMLSSLARINQALMMLDHPGLFVRIFESDIVTEANLGRQLFSQSEIGLNKGVAMANRLNRFFGSNWKAVPEQYGGSIKDQLKTEWNANITVSCVDTVSSRFEIASLFERREEDQTQNEVNGPLYWMDIGNDRDTGQVVLSTVKEIKQPRSQKYKTRSNLPFITVEFAYLLNAKKPDTTPSCSLAEALTKQDLFINSTLANLGGSLLWKLFREGFILYRGFFLNLKDFRSSPLSV